MEERKLTPTALKDAVGISMSYASMILAGQREPPLPLAVAIFRKTGQKLGPIATTSDEDIEVLVRLHGEAA